MLLINSDELFHSYNIINAKVICESLLYMCNVSMNYPFQLLRKCCSLGIYGYNKMNVFGV